MVATEIKKVSYWNENARWYKLWREHNSYHEPIINLLLNLPYPFLKVIDIGAGDGVLSFPLINKGYTVTALEPSSSMQSYLTKNRMKYGVSIEIDPRRFEELDNFELSQFDLAVACNSLHLTEYGIEKAVEKLFNSNVQNIFLVTEKDIDIQTLSSSYPEYRLKLHYQYLCESSFAYHSLQEALEHWRFKYCRELYSWEREKLLKSLSYKNSHFWLKDFVFVNILYWRKER